MSVGSRPGGIGAYMLRSSTPASNEKVLLYLEGMQKVPPDEGEKSSSVGSARLLSPKTRGGSVASSARRREELGGENLDDGVNHDIRSDIQEGNGSDIARTIPIHTTGMPEHEPGPDDPPGPRFESYGSSFGNFGPLRDSIPVVPNWNGQNTPSKAAGVPLPETSLASPTGSHVNPFQHFGMTPATAAGVPLPMSLVSAPASQGMDPTMSQGGAKSRRTGAPSKASQSGADALSNEALSPKPPSRALSPTRTVTGAPPERPWSPRSAASLGQSQRSRVTQKTSRTVYPPLPESTFDDNATVKQSPSPPSRTHNRSPSIAPSESASQYKPPKQSITRTTSVKEQSYKPPKSMKSIIEVDSGAAESHHGGGSPVSQRGGSRVTQREGSRISHREDRSQAPMSPRSQPMSQHRTGTTNGELNRAAAALSPAKSRLLSLDPEATPTPSRPMSPIVDLNPEEERLVNDLLMRPPRTRTSYAPSAMAPSMLEPEVQNSHFHDMELCQLLHALDQPMGEPVKKAVRKAVRARVKKLGMKYDNESIKEFRKSYHNHDPLIHMIMNDPEGPSSKRSTQLSQDAPPWARDLIDGMINMRERLDSLAPKIERSLHSSQGGSYASEGRNYPNGHHHYADSEMNGGYAQTGGSQMIHNQQTGTMGDESMFQPGDTEVIRESTHLNTLPGSMHHHDGSLHGAIREDDLYDDEEHLHMAPTTNDGDTRGIPSEYHDREDSSGGQYLEEELYKLRVRPTGSQSAATHKTWEVARDDGEDYDGEAQVAVTESGLPEILPDGETGAYAEHRGHSPPLPPIPHDTQMWQPGGYAEESRLPPPWQRIHQRLLSWAIVWPMTEIDNALNSTTRGMQVDEVALSIWSTQSYKRYVRSKMTDSPPGRVDRLFVPPNMADAISTAVYNGRHGDACGMLRDLWAPFGLEGIPRLLLVLAKHRADENHWVVHRFSLPDGSLTTYDTYPERCLPDGRPLGWWFAIRIAWPDAIYPSPDHIMQKMVRLHRPMQLGIDNSVAAAGIWRNLLMGSRAERSLDLERLRDLINTEVKNLRQRKLMGKLSIGSPRPNWEDMN